jgi:hypothetical protein
LSYVQQTVFVGIFLFDDGAYIVWQNGLDTFNKLPKNIFFSIQKWPICPISALRSKFFPRNINYMPVEKFIARLDLDQIFLFLDGHLVN